MIQQQKTSAKPDANKELVANAKKFEDAKEYNTLRFAKTLFDIRKGNAQVAAGFSNDMEGFKAFCGEYLNTGYHTAMRYIAIYKMVDHLAIDPAVVDEIGYSKLRAISSIANVDNVDMCLEKAKELNTHDLEEWVKAYKNSKNPDAAEGENLPMMKKFIFPASEEEVPVIDSTIRDVKALLDNNNNTTALIHICQSYMEFAYPHERKQALETIQKKAEDKQKQQETLKQKVVDPKTDKKAAQVVKPEKAEETPDDNVISENDIPKASLHELLAFAKKHNIPIDAKKATNKAAVKAHIIDVLFERADVSEETDLPETPVAEIEETPVVEEAPVVEETPVETPVEKGKRGRKAKAETEKPVEKPVEKAPVEKAKKAKEPKQETPVEVLPDPAEKVDEEKEITFEEAIAEIRNVVDKKQLVAVATSYGIELTEEAIETNTAETLIEAVVQELCGREGHEYIPPVDDDTSDLDAMIAGE